MSPRLNVFHTQSNQVVDNEITRGKNYINNNNKKKEQRHYPMTSI